MAHKSLTTSSVRYCTPLFTSSRSPLCWRLFTTSHPLSVNNEQRPPRQPAQLTTSTSAAAAAAAAAATGTVQQSTSTQRENIFNILGNVGTKLSSAYPSPASTGTTSQYGITNLSEKYNIMSHRRYGDDEYHLHVFSTKHNTHLTLANPERNSIMSISTGNLGFRKSQRGSYDAAYQLMAYLLTRLQQQGLMSKITKMELSLRGFGQGRDAVTKVLLGTEGTRLRDTIVRVVDKTKLKIGGPRSPKRRRLG